MNQLVSAEVSNPGKMDAARFILGRANRLVASNAKRLLFSSDPGDVITALNALRTQPWDKETRQQIEFLSFLNGDARAFAYVEMSDGYKLPRQLQIENFSGINLQVIATTAQQVADERAGNAQWAKKNLLI